jgi:hypothetical protein
VTRARFDMRLVLELVTADAKYCIGTTPATTSTG